MYRVGVVGIMLGNVLASHSLYRIQNYVDISSFATYLVQVACRRWVGGVGLGEAGWVVPVGVWCVFVDCRVSFVLLFCLCVVG